MHTFMCQRWNPIFPSGVFLIGKETGSDYKAIIHMQRQDFVHAKNIFEKKQSLGQNKMLLSVCKMWHKDTVGRLPAFLPFYSRRQSYVSGATTVHASNYDSSREKARGRNAPQTPRPAEHLSPCRWWTTSQEKKHVNLVSKSVADGSHVTSPF